MIQLIQLIQLLSICLASAAAASNPTQEVLDFWNEQDNAFPLDQPENAVFIMRYKDTGKSILTLLLTGAKLQSEKTCEGCDSYHILDKSGEINRTTSESKSDIPKLMIDDKSKVSYYDCPGFKDSKSSNKNITIAYFVDKLLKRVKLFKIVLVVNNLNFSDFLTNIVKLLRNIDAYKDGIAMVAARVKSTFKHVMSDAEVVQKIADYLQEVKTSLQKQIILQKHYLSDYQPNYDSEKLKLLDVLLQNTNKTENGYDRIGVLRKPENSGFIDEMPLIQSEISKIKKIIEENLQYVSRNKNEDFGLVISSKSHVYVNSLIHQIITSEILSDVSGICQEMKQYYSKALKEKEDFLSLNETAFEAYGVLNRIRSTELMSFLRELIDNTRSISNDSSVTNMRKHMEHMEFLLRVKHEDVLTPLLFKKHIDDVKALIEFEFNSSVNLRVVNLLLKTMPSAIVPVCDEILFFYAKFEQFTTDIYVLRDKLLIVYVKLSEVDIAKPQSLLTAIDNLGISISSQTRRNLNNLIEKTGYMMKKFKKYKSIMTFSQAKFKLLVQELEKIALWYDYLINIFNDLSSPIRETNEKENEAIEKLLNRYDTSTSVAEFGFERLSPFVHKNIDMLTSLGNLPLFMKRKSVLKVLLHSLIQNPTISCPQDSYMTVTGSVIRMSQITSDKTCWPKAKFIEIFASASVIIDSSVEKHGSKIEMAIMSPVWAVIGKRKIFLKGTQGESQRDADCIQSSQKGCDGNAGYSGELGGNFLGIGEIFHNGKGLTILSEGGKGGPGQKGGKGPRGINAPHTHYAPDLLKSIQDCYDSIFYSTTNCLKEVFDLHGFTYNIDSNGELKQLISKRGKNGTDGGPGGDGGVGGYGGKAGHIHIIALGQKTNINEAARDGSFGDLGKGGPGGDRALQSITLNLKWTKNGDSIKFVKSSNFKKSEIGPRGNDGQSSKRRSNQKPADDFYYQNQTIEKFKDHLRNGLGDNFRKSRINEFILLLESNGKVKKLFGLA